jgi:hypothetical protein
MCSGDMTLIPTRHNVFHANNYVESDVHHTCRRFQPLKEWVQERYNGSTAVRPVCPNGTHEAHGIPVCNGERDTRPEGA